PYGAYTYTVSTLPAPPAQSAQSKGEPIYDAAQMLLFRYGTSGVYPYSLDYMLGAAPAIENSNIDEYGISPSTGSPFDFAASASSPSYATYPWPGTYNSNMFYDVQDLFDPNKTGQNFVTAMLAAGSSNLDTPNRYTFQRLLDSIGMSSAPEYGVYVYSNMVTNLPLVPQPNWLRTKVNINYDNTAQIQAGPFQQTAAGPYGPFTPMPTNLQPW